MEGETLGGGKPRGQELSSQVEEVELSGGSRDSDQLLEACLHLECLGCRGGGVRDHGQTKVSSRRMSPSQGCHSFPAPGQVGRIRFPG